MAALALEWQSHVAAAETRWSSKPKIFTIRVFTEHGVWVRVRVGVGVRISGVLIPGVGSQLTGKLNIDSKRIEELESDTLSCWTSSWGNCVLELLTSDLAPHSSHFMEDLTITYESSHRID